MYHYDTFVYVYIMIQMYQMINDKVKSNPHSYSPEVTSFKS